MPTMEEYKQEVARQQKEHSRAGIVVNLSTLESWNESLAKENRQLGVQVTFLARSVLALSISTAVAIVLALVLAIALAV